MADIFISYSKKDHEEARLLAAYIEAQGYSVWWDTSLKSGEQFRKVIMTELGRARAAIVIWTENSIESDWVQSEAGRAHADRKLIPVKSKSLQYKDIPPPFDNMHIENIGQRENILGAIVAQLAKPESQVSAIGQISKKARYQFLSWLGIAGAAITLASNLQGMLTLARLTRRVFESWGEIFQTLWGYLLFFVPKVYGTDAMLLTLFSFVLMNMALCLRQMSGEAVPKITVLKALVPALVVLAILTIGMLGFDDIEQRDQAYGYFIRTVGYVASDMIAFVNSLPDGIIRKSVGAVYLLFFFLVVPLAPVVLAYTAVRLTTPLRLDWNALATRLWRIVGVIAILLALNFVSLWLEQQPWLGQLVK